MSYDEGSAFPGVPHPTATVPAAVTVSRVRVGIYSNNSQVTRALYTLTPVLSTFTK